MYSERNLHIHYFGGAEQGLYVTEFGHSRLTTARQVGPYVREVWLMHIVLRDICRFCEFDAQPGEGFIIARGQIHSFQADPGYEHYWLGFGGEDAVRLGALFHLNMAAHQKLRLQLDRASLEQMLRDAFEAADGPGGERKAMALLLSILTHHAPGNQRESGYVASACAFMRHNYHRHITMEEVARSVNLSEKHLCRLFRKQLNTTPLQYLISLRMNQARTLLQDTGLLVREVAAATGYPSQLSFSAAFSAYWGMPPSALRSSCSTKE